MNATPLPPVQGDVSHPEADKVTSTGFDDFEAALASLHRWSANLGDAAVTTAAALMQSAAKQAGVPAFSSLNPVRLWPSLLDVSLQVAQTPEALAGAQQTILQWAAGCFQAGLEVMLGAETGSAPSDRRFAAEAWETPSADMARRLYALNAECARSFAREVPVSEDRHRRELEFFTTAMVEALSPTNSLFSNPVAWDAMLSSEGSSLARGARTFAEDLNRSHGPLSIRQTDLTQFQVGENIAATPGKVVFRNSLFELLQYVPTTAQVHARPLVIITPWINKYYIVDLQPANSMVRWLTDQGFTVFVTSWVNPDTSYADVGFDDYVLSGVLVAIGKALEQTAQRKANVVGYCIGGTALACAMAYLAARKIYSPIESATFFAAQQDFSEAGELLLFSDETWLAQAEAEIDRAGGVLPGQVMAATFNQLRPRDLIWGPFVDNYLLGKPQKAFDLLFWNADPTRLPRTMHLGYIRDFYQKNAFSRGELELAGARLDPGAVKTPVYVLASREDHIAPFASVYRGARLFGGPVTFTLAGSGHIAGVINPPAKGKYHHWLNPALPQTPDEWLAQAQKHAGSWWPHWGEWLAERSGKQAPARDPALGPLPPLGDAPGRYVLERC
jgi:polyhydroxyalkanoate synthase